MNYFLPFFALLLLFSGLNISLAQSAEPTVQEVMAQSIKYAHLENDPLASLGARVRQAPWLPQFKTRFVRDADFGESVKEKIGEASTRFARDFSDYGFEVEARWEFDRLVFNPDELAVAREAGRISGQREQLISTVVELYFGRQLLLLESKQQSSTYQKNMDKLKIDELTARLDGITGGWFTQQLGAAL